jgi:phage terminase Nu1 subunit (DNA packaging protein)
MTTPQDREKAKAAANAALEKAEELRDRSESLAEQWRLARQQNNFRQMLRHLTHPGVQHD